MRLALVVTIYYSVVPHLEFELFRVLEMFEYNISIELRRIIEWKKKINKKEISNPFGDRDIYIYVEIRSSMFKQIDTKYFRDRDFDFLDWEKNNF